MDKQLKLLAFVLLSLSAHGQILQAVFGSSGSSAVVATSSVTFRSSCSAATTSCTLGSAAATTLQIAFTYRSASTTPPTLITGWTSITTGATSAGGTVGSFRLQCRVSSTTASGTATNASDIEIVAYDGSDANATADCPSTGIGNTATNNAKTSTTLNYPALPAFDGSGFSFTVGFAGSNITAGVCTPSGMTNRTSVGAGPAVTVADTNVTIAQASWPSTNCTVTSATWMSAVVEVLPHSTATTFATVIQHPTKLNCTTASCALTVTSTTAGNIGALCSASHYTGTGFTTTVAMTSVSDNGTAETWIHPQNAVINNAISSPDYWGEDCYYVLSMAGGATTITANWTLTGLTGPTIGVDVQFWELHPAGSAFYDTSNSREVDTNCTVCGGVFGLLSGTASAILQTAIVPTGHTLTAVSPPYANLSEDSGGNAIDAGFAEGMRYSYRTPSWTQSITGNPNFYSMIAFGNSSTPPLTANGLIDFSACTNGVAPTNVCVNSSSFSGWGLSADVSNIGSGMTVSTANSPNSLPAATRVNGTSYTGTSTLHLHGVTAVSGTAVQQVNIGLSAGLASATLGYSVRSTCTSNGSTDCGAGPRIINTTGADYATGHILNGTICLETTADTCPNHVAYASYATSTWYRVNILMNSAPTATAGTVTFSNGSAVITFANSFVAGQGVQFQTTGGLPTNFATATTYWVIATGLSSSQFRVAATPGGTGIAAGSAGSGTQSVLVLGIDRMTVCADGPGGSVLGTTINASNATPAPIVDMQLGILGEEPVTNGFVYDWNNFVFNGTYSTSSCF